MPDLPPLFAAYSIADRPWVGTFWWGGMSDAVLPDSYLEAARRLQVGAKDGADAERVLLPILYLYRHAIELQLKRAIQEAVAVRRALGDDAADLEYAAVSTRLMSSALGHKLWKLLRELEMHLGELELEALPDSSRKLLKRLNDTDLASTGFRYADTLKHAHVSIDLDRLAADLVEVYRTLDGIIGYLDSLTDM